MAFGKKRIERGNNHRQLDCHNFPNAREIDAFVLVNDYIAKILHRPPWQIRDFRRRTFSNPTCCLANNCEAVQDRVPCQCIRRKLIEYHSPYE